MNEKQLKQRRTLEFIGWIVVAFVLFLGASYYAFGKQESGAQSNTKVYELSNTVKTWEGAMIEKLDAIDKFINQYIDEEIKTSTDLNAQADKVLSDIEGIPKEIMERAKVVENADTVALFALADSYTETIRDKRNLIEYITGAAGCTEGMLSKCAAKNPAQNNGAESQDCSETEQKNQRMISDGSKISDALAQIETLLRNAKSIRAGNRSLAKEKEDLRELNRYLADIKAAASRIR